MSDDTPTQRFPSAADGDLATQRLDTAEIREDLHEEKQRSRGLLIGLIVAGTLLVIALIVLLVIILGRGAGEPQAVDTHQPLSSDSATPEATDSATPTPAPSETQAPPPPAGPTISAFTVSNTTVLCNTQSPTPSHQYLSFSWATSGSTRVYFGVDTDDASANALFDNLPQTGDSQNDFPAGYNQYEYACAAPSHTYTLTVVDGSGHKQSKSVTVVNNGDTQ